MTPRKGDSLTEKPADYLQDVYDLCLKSQIDWFQNRALSSVILETEEVGLCIVPLQ